MGSYRETLRQDSLLGWLNWAPNAVHKEVCELSSFARVVMDAADLIVEPKRRRDERGRFTGGRVGKLTRARVRTYRVMCDFGCPRDVMASLARFYPSAKAATDAYNAAMATRTNG
jgi:hypothetical protein